MDRKERGYRAVMTCTNSEFMCLTKNIFIYETTAEMNKIRLLGSYFFGLKKLMNLFSASFGMNFYSLLRGIGF